MAETIYERHYRYRLDSLRQIAFPDPANGSLSLQDFEDLVTLCAELAVSGRELLEQERKRVFTEPILTVAWLRERRQVIEELSDKYVRLAESIKVSACQAWEAAGSPTGKDIGGSLHGAIQAIIQAKNSLLERWLVGSDEEEAEAQAAANRGEGIELDEAFAQIAGVDVETWRRRIEEYQKVRQA